MRVDQVLRFAAFSEAGSGGNPAGVAILDALPSAEEMLRVAADIGFSETAFLAPLAAEREGSEETRPPLQNGALPGDALQGGLQGGLHGALQGALEDAPKSWRIRYFAPELEVPFCGHATIASGAALGERFGPGRYALRLNDGEIEVEAAASGAAGGWTAALRSPPTWAKPADPALAGDIRARFGLAAGDLAAGWPQGLAGAGARHLFFAVATRARLTALGPGGPLDYPFDEVKELMAEADLTTIAFFWAESDRLFHIRNAFAVGGVAEDPATGAAAAAFAGLLRELGRLPGDGRFQLLQGVDMGASSRILVEAGAEKGGSVRVSGAVRRLG